MTDSAPSDSANVISDKSVVATSQISKPLPALPLIYGDVDAISRSSVPFSAAVKVKPGTMSKIDLFAIPGLLAAASGRASAIITYPLQVGMIISAYNENATVVSVSGAACIRGEDDTAPSNVFEVASCPGHSTMNITMSGATTTPLGAPPLIRDNLKIVPVIGDKPLVYIMVSGLGVKEITVTLSGTVHVSGMSRFNPF
jgi:hypothetical protein